MVLQLKQKRNGIPQSHIAYIVIKDHAHSNAYGTV